MAVRLVEDGVHQVRLFPSVNLVPSGRLWYARGRGYFHGKLVGRSGMRKYTVARSIG